MSNIINNQMIEEIRNLLINSRIQIQETLSLKLDWSHYLTFLNWNAVSTKSNNINYQQERNLLIGGVENE